MRPRRGVDQRRLHDPGDSVDPLLRLQSQHELARVTRRVGVPSVTEAREGALPLLVPETDQQRGEEMGACTHRQSVGEGSEDLGKMRAVRLAQQLREQQCRRLGDGAEELRDHQLHFVVSEGRT